MHVTTTGGFPVPQLPLRDTYRAVALGGVLSQHKRELLQISPDTKEAELKTTFCFMFFKLTFSTDQSFYLH